MKNFRNKKFIKLINGGVLKKARGDVYVGPKSNTLSVQMTIAFQFSPHKSKNKRILFQKKEKLLYFSRKTLTGHLI